MTLLPRDHLYCAECFYCLDSHRPWGSPQDRARGGWVRWPACGLVVPHTDSGSGAGDSAFSFSASWTDGEDEGTIRYQRNSVITCLVFFLSSCHHFFLLSLILLSET